jgi:arsenical pump membrane protein
MNAAFIIACITILLFLFCILFSINFKIGERIRIPGYIVVSLLGGLAMIIFGQISLEKIAIAFSENTSVNPIKILVLFLSMTVFSLILERTNFFKVISSMVLKKSGSNQYVIFFSLYAIISLLTVFTSNDVIILTFTPFICYFCKSAKINPIPYLIMEFVAANTWSLLFLIGNPTNIYISSAFGITFSEYFIHMALPTLSVGLSSLLIMLLLFRKSLNNKIAPQIEIAEINNKPLMVISLAHLLICVCLLAISQYISIEMWIISLCMAISVVTASVICLISQRKKVTPVYEAIKKMPFEIIPFILGMFVIVLALDTTGTTEFFASKLTFDKSAFSFGFLSLFGSNILNNIPMSVLFSKLLAFYGTEAQIYATIVGSNIGAFITPVGALAGIMWSNLLRQNKIHISVARFICYGSLIGIPAMAISLILLEIIM